ncbi:hypothetical protein AGR6A_pa10047 [Agrobacterium sp. NCPPB 925]|nr:hypothetical protein AGR6A_pa10047 [Agrobacterium sp. NCPPB 925]
MSSEKIVGNVHANDLVRDAVIQALPAARGFLARVRASITKLLKAECDSGLGCIETRELAAACITMHMTNYLHPVLSSGYKPDNPGIENVINLVLQSVNKRSGPTL